MTSKIKFENWTIFKLLAWTDSYFKNHSIDSPRLTAELLLAHSLDMNRLDLYLEHDRPLEKNELSRFKHLIKRRIQNEPVAYITGEKGFFDSDFKVSNDVLIPRPDTETIVEQASSLIKMLENKKKALTILELGTGSGAIVVSLCKAHPHHHYFACDISKSALRIAKLNAQTLVNNQVRFFAGSWFSSIKQGGKFDAIVSNPPYIPTRDIKLLQPEIKEFEPMLALDGGKDGLQSYRLILEQAFDYLVPGGTLLLEMGFDQKAGISEISAQYPQYESIKFIRDLAGHNRVVLIKKSID